MENEEKSFSKNEREREIFKKIKSELEMMKFSSKPEQFSKIFKLLDELMSSRGISKNQVEIIKKGLN